MNRREETRWNSTSKDGAMLQSLVSTGAIDDKMTAAQVQQMYPQFAVYPNNTFAGNLRRFRQIHGPGGKATMAVAATNSFSPAGLTGPPQGK